VNPVIAVFLGWAVGGEQLTARILWAAGVIVLGVVIITLRKQTPAEAEIEAVNPSDSELKSVSSCIERREVPAGE
jgi:hypothetical protein